MQMNAGAALLCHPPETIAGIVVLVSPGRLAPVSLISRIKEFVAVLEMQPIDRELWIVEPGRVRIRQRSDAEGGSGQDRGSQGE